MGQIRIRNAHPPNGSTMSEATDTQGRDFIRTMIDRDLETGKYGGRVVTRFPPEPNGYLHIGHAMSICLNFGLADEYEGARCHLRFDDTNPVTEDETFVEAIQQDVRWLGFDWGKHLYFASDYFEQLYAYAVELTTKGLAYVDSSTEAEIQDRRGSVTEPGVESPYRARSPDESLDLLKRMRAGEFADGSHVLRARIDMAHPNMVMRDPVLIRIRHAHHYRTGDAWCIYPMYDFAHCLSDSIEGITHSLCTLEFENNREIYDWLLEHVTVPTPRPEQTEFARRNLDYTVTSKRKLRALVEEGLVRGWDDPRMPTLAGLRRRGVTPEAIRSFCSMIGVAKTQSRDDVGKLSYAVRSDLNFRAPRAFAVVDPVRMVITNYPEELEEAFEAPRFPADVGHEGTRSMPFSRELFIERSDVHEDPPPGFHRLVPGGEVRLKHAYIVRLDAMEKDPGTGEIVELRCSYDPDSRGGAAADGRRVKGTIHWVSARHAVPIEARLYEPLFQVKDPEAEEDFKRALNPTSETRAKHAVAEASMADVGPGTHVQFERLGYFFSDPVDSRPDALVFNRTVALRDSWRRKSTAPRREVSTEAAAAGPPDHPIPDTPSTPERRSPRELLRDDTHLARFDGLTRDGVPQSLAANLAKDDRLFTLYSEGIAHYPEGAATLAAWLVQEVGRTSGSGAVPVRPEALSELVRRVDKGRYSRHQGRLLLKALRAGTAELDAAEAAVLTGAESDAPDLEQHLRDLYDQFPDKVDAYRGGQTGLAGFFIGQVMKRTQGRADPREVGAVLKRTLD